jgi:hypothetical protein
MIRIGAVPEIGEIIGEHAENLAQAQGLVQAWCRGYLTRRHEQLAGSTEPHNKSLIG